jgi:hypothetical protein
MSNPYLVSGLSVPSPNQFNQFAIKGDVDSRDVGIGYDGLLNSAETSPLKPGTPVMLTAGTLGKVLTFSKAGKSDPIFGFIAFDLRSNNFVYPSNPAINVASTKKIMFMQASGPIPRGHDVAMTDSADVTIQKWVTGLTNIGIALDEATAADDIIRVQIETPASYEVVSS